MKMYHGETEITVHPSRVDEMIRKGWTTEEPTKAKPKRKAKIAIDTTEEINNGES
jgi:hypothetical protein